MGKNKKKQELAKPPNVPAKAVGIGELKTPPLNEAELEHLDAVTEENKPLDLKPSQPVSVECSECGEKRTYKLSQLPKTSDGAFVVGDLQCARCLAPAGVNIEGPVL